MVGEGWLDWLGSWQLSACPPPPVPWSRGEFDRKLKVGIILYLPPPPYGPLNQGLTVATALRDKDMAEGSSKFPAKTHTATSNH